MTDLSDDRELELYGRMSEAVTDYIYFMAERAGVTDLDDHCDDIYETIMDTIVSETD